MTLDAFKDQLQESFLWIFNRLYPFVHNHFVSYLLILALVMIFAYAIWLGIEASGKGKADSIFLKIVLIALEAFVVAFIIWYLMVHFRTFSDQKATFSSSEQKATKLKTPKEELNQIEETAEKSATPIQEAIDTAKNSVKKIHPKKNNPKKPTE